MIFLLFVIIVIYTDKLSIHSVFIGKKDLFNELGGIEEFKAFSNTRVKMYHFRNVIYIKLQNAITDLFMRMPEFRFIQRYRTSSLIDMSDMIINYFFGTVLILSISFDLLIVVFNQGISVFGFIVSLFMGVVLSVFATFNEIKNLYSGLKTSIRNDLLILINEVVLYICSGVSVTNSIFESYSSLENTYLSAVLKDSLTDYSNGGSMENSMESFRKNLNSIIIDKFVQIILNSSNTGDVRLKVKLSLLKDDIWDMRFRDIKEDSEKMKVKMVLPLMLNFIGIMMLLIMPIMLSLGGIFDD